MPWSVSQLGARAEYRFAAARAAHRRGVGRGRTTTSSTQYLHLALLNRGILMTPFHNMALMCPDTTAADVDRHTAAFREVVGALYD